MKKLLFAALVSVIQSAFAGAEHPELPLKISNETPAERDARLAWWRHDRFGMFIHFGLYAVPARHEWVQSHEFIDARTYESKYMKRFNPDLFDAKDWARTAKAAGMKYIVLTTKHHEGFCMWDTKTTNFKITNTEFGRDLVREYVDACRAEGLKVGFYFSIKDWHHPDYTVDATHPLRPRIESEWTKEAFDKLNAGKDWSRYRDYMYAQIRELLTEYGKIDIIWFDYTVKHKFGKTYKDWDSVRLVKMTRELQPGILIDSRLDLMDTDDGWDFVTPEQFRVQCPPTIRGKEVPWETCQTFSGSWGYYRDEETWKSVPQLLGLLIHSVSMGGNLILNVGPTARGEFDGRAKNRLEGFAKWMHSNSRSIYGCGPAPADLSAPAGTELTYNAARNCVYVHLYDYPFGTLPIKWLDRVDYAQFLHDGSEIALVSPRKRHLQGGEQKTFYGGFKLPTRKPAVEIPVIEVWLKD